jgi:hypothetical protein
MQNEKICMASAWLQRKFDASETESAFCFSAGSRDHFYEARCGWKCSSPVPSLPVLSGRHEFDGTALTRFHKGSRFGIRKSVQKRMGAKNKNKSPDNAHNTAPSVT